MALYSYRRTIQKMFYIMKQWVVRYHEGQRGGDVSSATSCTVLMESFLICCMAPQAGVFCTIFCQLLVVGNMWITSLCRRYHLTLFRNPHCHGPKLISHRDCYESQTSHISLCRSKRTMQSGRLRLQSPITLARSNAFSEPSNTSSCQEMSLRGGSRFEGKAMVLVAGKKNRSCAEAHHCFVNRSAPLFRW